MTERDSDLQHRVERLQSEARYQRAALALLAVGLFSGLAMGRAPVAQSQKKPDAHFGTIRAEEVVLTDRKGNPRIRIRTIGEIVEDHEGTAAQVLLYDGAGQMRLGLTIAGDDVPSVAMYDARGDRSLDFSLAGAPQLNMFAAKRHLVSLSADGKEGNWSALSLFGGGQSDEVTVTTGNQSAGLYLYRGSGLRLVLGEIGQEHARRWSLPTRGPASLLLSDGPGRVLRSLP